MAWLTASAVTSKQNKPLQHLQRIKLKGEKGTWHDKLRAPTSGG